MTEESCIRPVTGCFPSSQAILDESNLPFGCVVTPLVGSSSTSSASESASAPRLLAGIAKCLHCGAPHPDTTTHFPIRGGRDGSTRSAALLCFLCGRVSSSVRATAANEGTTSGSDASKGPQTFCLPLRLSTAPHSSTTSSSSSPPIYAVPAASCPPLWFLVLDGACQQPEYWQQTSRALRETLAQAPPCGLRVCVLLVGATSSSRTAALESIHISVLALDRPVPQLLHWTHPTGSTTASHNKSTRSKPASTATASIASNEQGDEWTPEAMAQLLFPHLVPLDMTTAGPALQKLETYRPDPALTNHSTSLSCASVSTSVATTVAWTTELILLALTEAHAAPAGQRQATITQRPYAGGKITFLLRANCRNDINNINNNNNNNNDSIPAATALAGRIAYTKPGHRFHEIPDHIEESSHTSNVQHNGHLNGGKQQQQHDIEAGENDDNSNSNSNNNNNNNSSSSSHEDWTPEALAQHYPDLDLLEYSDLGQQCAEWALGVDLLAFLPSYENHTPNTIHHHSTADMAWAMLQPLADKSGAPGPVTLNTSQALESELQMRAPWNLAFGAEFRVRITTGFAVEDQSVDFVPGVAPGRQLAPLYCQAGLAGPASPVPDASHLWRLGTCDEHTALLLDLCLTRANIPKRWVVEGLGPVPVKPVLQTCLAYTAVIPNPETGAFETVRRMRIASQSVPLAQSVEDLYDALDPEALAVTLFHKLAMASFQEGLTETAEIGASWLQSFLVCVYRSAELQVVVEEEAAEKGLESSGSFFPQERLLDREGELSPEDVLLAQGHPVLSTVPLMVYLLLQCDPLRVYGSPSLDLRVSALWQLSSLVPSALARAIAPRLSLWQAGGGSVEDDNAGPILEVMDLSSTAVTDAVIEFSQTITEPLLLFLDAPHQILVLNAQFVLESHSTSNIVPGPSTALQRAVQEAADSYRTPPPIQYALQSSQAETALSLLADVLAEDAPIDGEENFAAWRSRIAEGVNEDLLESA